MCNRALHIRELREGPRKPPPPGRSEITQAWRVWFRPYFVEIKPQPACLVNFRKDFEKRSRKTPSSTDRRASAWAITVWATGFSVAQTVISVTDSVWPLDVFPPPPRFAVSIFACNDASLCCPQNSRYLPRVQFLGETFVGTTPPAHDTTPRKCSMLILRCCRSVEKNSLSL